MSNRKETPDLLGEILNGPAKPAAPAQVEPKAEIKLTPQPSTTATPSKPKLPTSTGKSSSRWNIWK